MESMDNTAPLHCHPMKWFNKLTLLWNGKYSLEFGGTNAAKALPISIPPLKRKSGLQGTRLTIYLAVDGSVSIHY
jgi:hypothetical protein